jgi:phage terminase large subunit GpA-like protein
MDDHDGADAIERAWRDGLKPDPLLTVSEWADRYRVLSQRASSEPGRWRTERTPYLKEIMDCLSPASPVQRVALMKGAQIGGTECGNCWIGYVIHQAPGPMMAVAPTVELAKRNSKQRIDPLIEESEVLRERVKERRSRDSGNTVLSKEFPGGVLILTGANSAVGLRSMPARYLFLDEVDGYPRRRRGRRRSDPAGRAALGDLPAAQDPAGLDTEDQEPVADPARVRGQRPAAVPRAVPALPSVRTRS